MNKKYAPVHPPLKRLKKTITGITLYFLGTALQTAARLNPEVKKEISTLPENFCFIMTAEPKGPRMVLLKTGGRLIYKRGKEEINPDIILCMKNIEFTFRMMLSLLSNSEVVWQNRAYVRGDLNLMTSILRCFDVAQAIIFPNFLVKRYIKYVPPLTFRTAVNRLIFYTAGILGIVK
ncbi:MAG: hypothetical protein MUC95_01430 [Spirochaetes bacterium]|jgi:hypothetical protein|nr:hypothetical protein [Spirochaetota bacterium]